MSDKADTGAVIETVEARALEDAGHEGRQVSVVVGESIVHGTLEAARRDFSGQVDLGINGRTVTVSAATPVRVITVTAKEAAGQ